MEKRSRGGRPSREIKPGERVPMSFRVTPEMKAKIDAAAETSGRSQTQEVEFRLEQSFRTTELLPEALSLAYGKRLAGLLMIVAAEMRGTGRYYMMHVKAGAQEDSWLENPYAFSLSVEAAAKVLGAATPTTNEEEGHRPGFNRDWAAAVRDVVDDYRLGLRLFAVDYSRKWLGDDVANLMIDRLRRQAEPPEELPPPSRWCTAPSSKGDGETVQIPLICVPLNAPEQVEHLMPPADTLKPVSPPRPSPRGAIATSSPAGADDQPSSRIRPDLLSEVLMLSFDSDIALQVLLMGMAMQNAVHLAGSVLNHARGGRGEMLTNPFMHAVAEGAAKKVFQLTAPLPSIPEHESEDEETARLRAQTRDRLEVDLATEVNLDELIQKLASRSLRDPRGWNLLREIIGDEVLERTKSRQLARQHERIKQPKPISPAEIFDYWRYLCRDDQSHFWNMMGFKGGGKLVLKEAEGMVTKALRA